MANSISLSPGATLRHGTYRIERVLGQGGFGITYLATDLALERYVAIKEFFPSDLCNRDASTSHVTIATDGSVDFVDRLKVKFLKEARNIAKFDHPGIIKIHAAFEENNTAYYVMDYIEGESLSSMVGRCGTFSPEQAVDVIRKVGSALEYVHSHLINHLDVKPANVMVRSKDNNPILIDFGLSKQYDREGQQTTTTPVGISHGYAPMEQYDSNGVREFTPQTDIYALGATLYNMLTATEPPQAYKVVEEGLTFPPTIPVAIVDAITKAMQPRRFDRYSTVGEFLAALPVVGAQGGNYAAAQGQAPSVQPISVPHQSNPVSNPHQSNPVANNPISGSDNKTQRLTPQPKKSGGMLWIGIGAALVAVIVVAIIFFTKSGSDTSPVAEASDSTKVSVAEVATTTIPQYESAFGVCKYEGEVDENGLPHGHGVATWTGGFARSYDGEWNHGVMEGQTVYINSNNFRFEGNFKDNRYSEGKLIAPDGSYFEGTFDEQGDKYTGAEYDPKGNQLETWVKGE